MTTREKDDVETSPFSNTWSLFLFGTTRYRIPGFQEPGVGLRYSIQQQISNVPVPQYRVSMPNRKDSPKFTIHIYRLHKDFLYKYASRVCTVFPCKLLMHQNPSKCGIFCLSHDQNGSLGGAWLAAPHCGSYQERSCLLLPLCHGGRNWRLLMSWEGLMIGEL